MKPKKYHYNMQIPLLAIIGCLFFSFWAFMGLRAYYLGAIYIDSDPRTSREITAAFTAEHFPVLIVFESLFLLILGLWMLLLAWRSTISLLRKDQLPLVFTKNELRHTSLFGKQLAISWAEMDRVVVNNRFAWFRSKDGRDKFKIIFNRIEGLDKDQLKKDVSRYHPDAKLIVREHRARN